MAAAEIAFYTERLAQKEHELGEIKSAFHKYKLKQKVKYDTLKREIAASHGNNGGHVEGKQNAALLQIRVAELETELDESRVQAKHLEDELARRQTQLNDHMILIKNLESQLKDLMPVDKIDKKNQKVDMEKVHQQMLYKDQRIIELNNVILDKERQILDLQEMCREQGEVANSKNQAMKIVQKKFEQLEARGKRDVGTETEPFPAPLRPREREAVPRGASRSLSPGHAVVSKGAGGASPPPLDPQDGEDRPDDEMIPGFSGFKGTNLDEEVTLQKKQRKRVTFDLPPSTSTSTMNLNGDPAFDQLRADISRLSDENARLMAELDNKTVALVKAQTLLEENDMELAKLVRDTKHSSLKARAVAHSRIKELEETLSELNEQHVLQVSRLQIEMDTLRSTREWEIEQNGLLRNQLDQLREKNIKFTGELDATGKLNRDLEQKVTILSEELEDATKIAVMMDDERQEIMDDVEKMKEAILAQDEFISLLEADIVIYEEHVGLLRDSLGASKVDHRSLLRSKAFETKLKALEQEKEQISLKSREEKLRTKALTQKVKLLEEENEKLMERLCEKEMGAEEDAEMAETCRQLELRLREADEQMVVQRTQYDIELETARVQQQQAQRELAELRFQLDVHQRPPQDHQQQTNVREEEQQQLLEQVNSQEAKIRELSQQISALEAELDAAKVLNFDLESQAKEAKELERDYDELIERHRVTCMELVEVKEKLAKVDNLLATISTLEEENKTIREKTGEVQRQNVVLTTELEAARVTFTETTLLKKELGHLQSELERERTVGQQKWEEFCKKALEGEYSEPGSRKNSMEIQKEQYIIAFEEKIDKLEEELAASNTRLAQEEQTRNELEQKLKEKEEAILVKSEPLANQPQLEEEHQLKLQEQEEIFEDQKAQLQNKIKDLEIENGLAAELGIEMGRVIQTYEAQINQHGQSLAEAGEKAHSAMMELRLHEMMNEELGKELDQLRQNQVDLENKLAQVTASLQESETLLNDQVTTNRTLTDQNQVLYSKVEQLQAQPPPVTHQEHVSETIVFNETVVQQSAPQTESAPLPLSNSDNDILRQCVNETLQLQEDMSHDVEKLLELKNELEIAVDALKGEIWTLNGQLKASILDREQLQDRVIDLDTSLAEEQRKSSALDCELSEQVELTEKATRQAAEAENESNRRLDECHEMESRRIELEQAYAQLTEYYNQLQAAYNQLYASSQSQASSEVQQSAPTSDPSVILIINSLMVDMQLELASGMDTRAKITAIQQKIREKLREVEQLNTAVKEQGKVNEALQERMSTLEANTELTAGESLEMKNKLHQLEGDLEWKQEECDSLRRQVDELQQALNNVIVNDGDDAAKLATRQADVDSLFRTNAELAHTNVRLQNEIDDREEKEQQEEGSSEEHKELVEKVKQLELKLEEWAESKEEIERLKGIEKTLNNRILSLEDQLLEKEEQLQEMEEQMLEQRAEDNSEQLRQLQQTNSVVMEELKGLREERDSLRRTIEEMECERNNRKEEAVSQREAEWNWDGENTGRTQLETEIERLKKEKAEDEKRASEEIKQYQDELEEMQTELEVMKQKMEIKEEKEEAWDDWAEKEETSPNLQEEVERLKAQIESSDMVHQKEKEDMKVKIQELQQTETALRQQMEDVEEEAKKLQLELEARETKEEASEQWGWDEEKPEEETNNLQEEVNRLTSEMERSDMVHQKEKEDMEAKIQALENELQQSKAALKQEMEDVVEETKKLKLELEARPAKEEASEQWGWDEEKPQGDLQQEMESLRQNIDELRLKLEESEKSEEQYRSQVAELEVQLNSGHQSRESYNDGWGEEEEEGEKQNEAELKNQLELAQQQLAIVSVDLEEKKAELEKLEEQKKRLEAEKKTEVDELKQNLAQLEAENEEIAQDLNSVRSDLKTVTQREKQLQQQHEEISKQLKKSEEENIALKAAKSSAEEKQDGGDWGDGWGESEGEKEDLSEELAQTKGELQKANIEIAKLRSESEEVQKVVETLKEEQALLKEKERSLQEALEQSKAETSEEGWNDGWGENANDGSAVEDQTLREELERTQQELKETVQKLGLIMPEIHKLESTITDLEEKVGELTANNSSLQNSLTEMTRKNEKLDQIVSSEVAQNESNLALTEELNQKLDQTTAKLAELQQECQLLREENLKLEEASIEQSQAKDGAWGDNAWGEEESKDSLKEELEQTQQKLSEVSSLLEQAEVALTQTRETARTDEEELKQQIKELEEQLKVSQESEALGQELLEKTSELASLTKQLDSVLKQNNLLKESEGRLLESVDDWGEIAEKNEEECKRLQKVVNDLERRQMELEEEIEMLKAEIEKMKATPTGPSDNTSALELEKLRKEHDALKNKLLIVEAKLAEVEKEKSTIKASYDQLRSKIAARRAAANNTPSRAPSVASSIGDIREEPSFSSAPVPTTPLRFSPVPSSTQQAQLSVQEADGKIRDFVGDVKEFADRVYNFASFRLDDIIGFEQSLNHLEMGKKGKKAAAKKSSASEVVSDPPTEASSSPANQDTAGINNIVDVGSEHLPQFDAQLLVNLAARLREYDAESLQNVQAEMLQWVSLDPNLNGDPHHLPAILPSVYSVLKQLDKVLSAQRVNHQQAVEQMDVDFKEKEERLVAGFQSQQFAAAVELKRVSEQLNSLSQDLAELDLLRRDAARLEKEREDGREIQEQLKQQNEAQEQLIRTKETEAAEMKKAVEQSQSELEAAKKKVASLMEQGDELYRKLFEMHQEGDQVDAMRVEIERAKAREAEMEEKFGELHAVYGTMKDAFEEHLKRGKVAAEEKEEQRRRVEEMQNQWHREMSEREGQLEEVAARLDEANASLTRKEFRLAQLGLEVEELRAAAAHRNSATATENLQRSAVDDDLRARNELLQAALEARDRNLDVLQTRVDELEGEAVFTYNELQNLTADRQSLMEELNEARFQLEQVEESEQNSIQAAAKVRELQRKISIMEGENYEKVAQITLQLQQYEEQLMSASEKEVELQDNLQSVRKEVSEWRSRCESLSAETQALKEAGATVLDLESSLTEAKESTSSLLAENASLRSQLAATCAQKNVAEEQVQGLAQQLQESSNKLAEDLTDNQLKFRFVELESRLVATERERDALKAAQTEPKETRIQMEPDTASLMEGASDVEAAGPSTSTSAHHSLLDDVVEHVRHSSLVRAGSPMTAPLVRKIRAFLSRRAIRPYVRYLVACYFILVHFLLINCWIF